MILNKSKLANLDVCYYNELLILKLMKRAMTKRPFDTPANVYWRVPCGN